MIKRVIVTGASSGIGKATAELFLLKGHKVVLVGRKKETLLQVIAELENKSPEVKGRAFAVEADVSKSADCKRLVEEGVQHLGGLDILVNNAGVSSKPGSTVELTPEEEWDSIMNINLKSIFLITKHAIPELEKAAAAQQPKEGEPRREWSTVVNISSVGAYRGFAGLTPYCVSKAGVDHITRCSSLELAPKGIRVNAINPGAVETNFTERTGIPEQVKEGYYKNAAVTNPLGRNCLTEECADLIHFLATKESSFLNGQCITIDGARSLVASIVVPPSTSK